MRSPVLLYGASGSGKTSWYERIARYLWEKEGKRTRWLLGDGGGQTLEACGAVGPGGFVDVMHYHLWSNPFSVTPKICEGWWPADPQDPKSKLLPPTADTWQQVGAVIFEGTNVMGDYMMGSNPGGLADRAARSNETYKDRDKEMLVKFTDGDVQVASNVTTHYMMVQQRMLENIQRTEAIPVFVGWSAHEGEVYEGKGDARRLVYVGPDVVGSALTRRIGASFGHVVHLVRLPVQPRKMRDEKLGRDVRVMEAEYRAYLQPHYDPQGLNAATYFANVRVPEIVTRKEPTLVPEYIPADPFAFFDLTARARARGEELSKAELANRTITLA